MSLFPTQIQWLVTLIILISLIFAFIALVRYHWIFIIVLIILLPAIIPVLRRFFTDIYNFFLYLLNLVRATSPKA